MLRKMNTKRGTKLEAVKDVEFQTELYKLNPLTTDALTTNKLHFHHSKLQFEFHNKGLILGFENEVFKIIR